MNWMTPYQPGLYDLAKDTSAEYNLQSTRSPLSLSDKECKGQWIMATQDVII